jgi:predicted transcriptional regulator
MVLADDRILEYIKEKDAAGSTEMAESDYVRYSQSYISRRCKKLVEHDLLREVGSGVYMITDRGERYLDGEIDTSEDAPDEIESPFENGPEPNGNHEQA